MRLTMAKKRALINSFAPRYRRKRKKVKGEVLTRFFQMRGHSRCYEAYLLRLRGQRIWGGRHPEKLVGNGSTSTTRKFHRC